MYTERKKNPPVAQRVLLVLVMRQVRQRIHAKLHGRHIRQQRELPAAPELA